MGIDRAGKEMFRAIHWCILTRRAFVELIHRCTRHPNNSGTSNLLTRTTGYFLLVLNDGIFNVSTFS